MLKNKKIHRWLSGSFICKKCEREFHTMSFVYGEIIDRSKENKGLSTLTTVSGSTESWHIKSISEWHRTRPPSIGSRPSDKVHLKLEMANASEKARC